MSHDAAKWDAWCARKLAYLANPAPDPVAQTWLIEWLASPESAGWQARIKREGLDVRAASLSASQRAWKRDLVKIGTEADKRTRYLSQLAAGGPEAELARVGTVRGQHYALWKDEIVSLTRQGRLSEALALIDEIVVATRRENDLTELAIPPWWEKQRGVVARKLERQIVGRQVGQAADRDGDAEASQVDPRSLGDGA